MKIGIAQMRSTADAWANLELVKTLIKEAEANECDLVCFPENVFYRGPRKTLLPELVLELKEGRLKARSGFAKELYGVLENTPLALSLGSVLERSPNPARPYNSHWFVLPDKRVASYQKIHLFQYSGTKAKYQESKSITPGEALHSVSYGDFCFGLSICYDLRFPELYRALTFRKGANVLLVPAAFTRETGRAHWHTLLRSRAIENLSYVIAPAQWGEHESDEGTQLPCYGHSVAYGPWGETLGESADSGDGLLYVKIELKEIQKRREQLPTFESAELLKDTDHRFF